MDGVRETVLQMLVLDRGAVDAEFPVFGVELEQRLDAPALVPQRGCGAGILLGHGSARPVDHAARAEDAPGDDHTCAAAGHRVVQHPLEIAGGVVDRQEFVGVEDQHPIGSAHQRFVLRVIERRGLRFDPFGDDIGAVVAEPQFLEPHQHLVGAVGTVVGVDEDVGEAHGKVMGEPFHQEGCFVLHHRDGHDSAVFRRGLEMFHACSPGLLMGALARSITGVVARSTGPLSQK